MNFPPSLPRPTQVYSGGVDPFLATTQFETSLRQRQRFTDTYENISVTWSMSQLQFDVFQYFVRWTLVSGSLDFNTDILGLDGIENREVTLLGGQYQYKYAPHARVTVSATLVSKVNAGLPTDIYEILLLDELEDAEAFLLISDTLYTYIEFHYGDSESLP